MQPDKLMNPLDFLKNEIEKVKVEVKVAVETAVLRESLRWQLARLITLDTDRTAVYQEMFNVLGEL